MVYEVCQKHFRNQAGTAQTRERNHSINNNKQIGSQQNNQIILNLRNIF